MGERAAGSPRNLGIDAVRVLALVAVVVGHVWYVPSVARWTYSWHVPVFFILAGYLWPRQRTQREDFRLRFRSILVPYAAWWLVVLAAYVGGTVAMGDTPTLKRAILAAWGGVGAYRPWSAFWFFTAFFIAVTVVRAVPRWAALVIGLAALAFCHVAHGLALLAPLAAPAGLASVLFVLVGRGLHEVRGRVTRPGAVGLVAVLAGLAAVALVPGYEPLEIKEADFGTPVLTVVVACLIGVGLILVAEALTRGRRDEDTATSRAITAVAACAPAVFLSHGILLFWLQTPVEGRWLDFVLVLGIPLALALVLVRTPLAPWFVGRAPLRRQ